MFRGFDAATLKGRYRSINKAIGRVIPQDKQDMEEANLCSNFAVNADASFTIVHDDIQFRMFYVNSGQNLRLTYDGDKPSQEIKDIVKKFNTVGL